MSKKEILKYLPLHLSERTRIVSGEGVHASGEFVVYWMSNAIRADENPALDVAKHLAVRLKLPLVVYQGLSQRYAYASDRHHTFILQAARDVQCSLAEQRISYAFYLERPASAGKYLKDLAKRAAVVVAEDMPTGPQPVFLRAIQRTTNAPLLSVDTACIVPMRLVGKAYERAFQFRSKTKGLFAERVTRDWHEMTDQPDAVDLGQLPFEPVDLQSLSIPELVAQCEIDHTVGPVLDTVGGSVAGYSRWTAFLRNGLRQYAKKRNDALIDGVSRMSAYLHYGMVSPFRLAREAAAQKNGGADKFLDELLIWRELAYCFCFYRPTYEDWSVLPDWAQTSLQKHASDPRPDLYTWEELARGQTQDELWNAAQKSLLIHGELHNNVRMTWGKAVLGWKRTPQEALQTVIDLNHRYALDGRDPNSYGGILWCFGQFDRPFQPERQILGTVRERPTAVHAQRLDPARYAAKTSVSRIVEPPITAVVGGGISGAIAARTLADHGLRVILFEKSRGAGGRMATRHTDFGDFDHGAQYFTARDERFRRYVESWIEQGLVASWDGKLAVYDHFGTFRETTSEGRFVGVPSMNSIAKHVVRELDLRSRTVVKSIRQSGNKLELFGDREEQLGSFDHVIVATPPSQTAAIVQHFDEFAANIRNVTMNPCWAVMASFADPLPVDWAGAFVNVGPLRWIAKNNTKPGREAASETITLHAGPQWSQEFLEHEDAEVCGQLLAALWQVTGIEPLPLQHAAAHRWRYSIPAEPLTERCLSHPGGQLIACGDWAGGPRVEGAFLSGCAAAGQVLRSLDWTPKPVGISQLELF